MLKKNVIWNIDWNIKRTTVSVCIMELYYRYNKYYGVLVIINIIIILLYISPLINITIKFDFNKLASKKVVFGSV